MNQKILRITIFFMLIFTSGCSVIKKTVYSYDVNQGNYLTIADVEKIHIGMTKKQVAYTLGTAMMKDLFDPNIWYYVSRSDNSGTFGRQKNLTLIFNSNGILIYIDNK